MIKKKRIMVILVAIAVLIAACCIGVYATKNYKNIIPEGGMYQKRIGAPKTKTFEVGELSQQPDVLSKDTQVTDNYKEIVNSLSIAKSGTKLKYKETVVYSETNKIDVYTDENQNEYRYNLNGELVTFNANAMAVDTITGTIDKDTITIDDVKALAPKYAAAIFGDDFNGYTMDNAEYYQSIGGYNVTFTKKYGEGNFIKGEHCFVQILPNGALRKCNISRGIDYDDLDTQRLEGITEKTILDFVKTQVEAEKGIASYEIYGIYFEYKENDFCIQASVSLTYDSGICEMKEYFYELE